MKRKLKHFKKSFQEFNKRRKERAKKPITEKAYAELSKVIAVSRDGKINPVKQRGIDRAVAFFGKTILTERKVCIHCGKKKYYIEFIVRYDHSSIQNVCKDCDQDRKKKYN